MNRILTVLFATAVIAGTLAGPAPSGMVAIPRH